jgi:hypothetical protein
MNEGTNEREDERLSGRVDEWPNRTQTTKKVTATSNGEQARNNPSKPLPPSEPHGPGVKQHGGRGVDVVHQPGGG